MIQENPSGFKEGGQACLVFSPNYDIMGFPKECGTHIGPVGVQLPRDPD